MSNSSEWDAGNNAYAAELLARAEALAALDQQYEAAVTQILAGQLPGKPLKAPPKNDRLLRADEVTRRIGFSRRTLGRWVSSGWFPPPVLLGGHPRWRESAVQGWLDNLPTREQRHDAG